MRRATLLPVDIDDERESKRMFKNIRDILGSDDRCDGLVHLPLFRRICAEAGDIWLVELHAADF